MQTSILRAVGLAAVLTLNAQAFAAGAPPRVSKAVVRSTVEVAKQLPQTLDTLSARMKLISAKVSELLFAWRGRGEPHPLDAKAREILQEAIERMTIPERTRVSQAELIDALKAAIQEAATAKTQKESWGSFDVSGKLKLEAEAQIGGLKVTAKEINLYKAAAAVGGAAEVISFCSEDKYSTCVRRALTQASRHVGEGMAKAGGHAE